MKKNYKKLNIDMPVSAAIDLLVSPDGESRTVDGTVVLTWTNNERLIKVFFVKVAKEKLLLK